MSSRKLRFDGWVLDPESGDLERGDTRMRLQEQPVQVLRELIAHAGSVVPREQLIALLWPKGVVDFDAGLNTVIRKLRSTLGDTSETPRYIETLPRRGYRFIGALDPDPQAPSAGTPSMPGFTASGASPGPAPASDEEPAEVPEAGAAVPKGTPSAYQPDARNEATSSTAAAVASVRRPRLPAQALIAAFAGAALLASVYALWRARSAGGATGTRVEASLQSGVPANIAPSSTVAFVPPPHSIAVLPFVNLSGDKEQEYFSDGLTEELLNSLAHIDGLQVAARTSSFSFREHPDIREVAHKLNVATVLEGSVRRSGHTVRITAQLNNALTGFHLWSETYDRDLGDVLKLQTDIANAVAGALKIRLLADEAAKIEVGGTHNPAAFDAYLRGSTALRSEHNASGLQGAITAYTEATRLDPNYALAFAGRSQALTRYATEFATGTAIRGSLDKSQADARHAIGLAPELAEGHLALGLFLSVGSLDFAHASEAYERAMALAPGNAVVLGEGGRIATCMGRFDAGLAAAHRAVRLDPLNPRSRLLLARALYCARRYQEVVAASAEVITGLDPEYERAYAVRGLAYYELGDFQNARSSCESRPDHWLSRQCLAVVYDRLGRHGDAEAELEKMKATDGDADDYQYAAIYAQWGNTAKALEWLESAVRVRDAGLVQLKTDPFMDPLRGEPRFKAIERQLKFPD